MAATLSLPALNQTLLTLLASRVVVVKHRGAKDFKIMSSPLRTRLASWIAQAITERTLYGFDYIVDDVEGQRAPNPALIPNNPCLLARP